MKSKPMIVFAVALSVLLSFSVTLSKESQIEVLEVDSQVPAAVLPTRSYQFEPVLDGFEVRHDFVIQNKGSAPLFISRVKTG